MARFRHLVFTLQLRPGAMVDVTDEQYANQIEQAGGDTIKYCIFQREVAPTTGQVHLQGYICFTKKMRRSTFVNLHVFQRETCWFEAARGTLKQCEEYCSKDDSRCPGHTTQSVRNCYGMPSPILIMFLQFGVRPQQGKRSDVPDVVNYIQENPASSWTDMALAEPRVANMMR